MGRKRAWKRKYLYLCVAGLTFLPLLNCATSEGIRERNEARDYLLSSQKLMLQGNYERSLLENLQVLSLPADRSYYDEALLNMGLIYAHFDNPNRDFRRSAGYFKQLVQDYPQSPLAEQAKAWIRILQDREGLQQMIEKSNQTLDLSKQEIERLKASKQPVLVVVEEPRPPKSDERPAPKIDKPSEPRRSPFRTQELLAQGDFDQALKENERLLASRSMEDEALFNMGVIYIHFGNPKRDHLKSLGFFRKLIKEHPQSPWSDQAKVWSGILQDYEKLLQDNEKLHQEIEKLRQMIEKSKQVDIEIEEKKREKTR